MWENSCKREEPFRCCAILGTGLIGGSIGLALREKRLVEKVCGYDEDKESLKEAVSRGALDEAKDSPLQAVQEADLVIIAVPVLETLPLLKEVLPHCRKKALITDVGSTKGPIMAAAAPLVPRELTFIGGHPMAGSEISGIHGADPALLENAIYVLTPASGESPHMVERLSTLVVEMGAQPLVVDPLVHDRVVAAVSHLPHLAAAALVSSVSTSPEQELVLTLAAGGFRDSTRIALGNPRLWKDICISNRWALLSALKSFRTALENVEEALNDTDTAALEKFFLHARDYRRTVPHRGKGILPELHDLIVLVRDVPGAIGRLATLLGKAEINIDAIEILHVRELSGGSIRLGFRNKEAQGQALDLLRERGYSCHGRS